MKKRISIFLLLFMSLYSIQAQKLESIEKKVFSNLIKYLDKNQLPILSYCLGIDIDSASFDRIKNELIKTTKSAELKKSFYKNGNQFDKEWVEVLLNPIIKYKKEPKRVLDEKKFSILEKEINRYSHEYISDINSLKLKSRKFLEWKFKLIDGYKGEKLWSEEYYNRLQNDLQHLIDTGKISTTIIEKYYNQYSTYTHPISLLNPPIYKTIKLYNKSEATLLEKNYNAKPRPSPTTCNCKNQNEKKLEKDYTESPDIKDNDIPYYTEESAIFPGGDDALRNFIRMNINYPQYEKEEEISGKVLVRFVIDKDGNVCNVEILKKLSHGVDIEAKRVVEMMPQWTPAKNDGKTVCVYYALPINFTLGNK